MKTIVLGYDDTEPDARSSARRRARESLDAHVVAVSARARPCPPAGIGPIDPTDPPELHREELHHAKAVLDELDIAADYDVGLGDPADLILRRPRTETPT